MKTIIEKISKLPWWFKNIYFITTFLFLIWMLFFDRNNVITSYRTNKNLNTLRIQKQYYIAEIEKVNTLKDELFSTADKKEKFAREKYLMKKDNEDLYIIVEN